MSTAENRFPSSDHVQPRLLARRTVSPSPLRSELASVISVAAPLAAGFIAETAMNFADLVIVGRLGSTELAAVSLTANLAFSLLFVCMGVVSAVSVFAAQAHA